uniref:Endonuclease-reverse transcriptase n=1 Tax=Plectus sambesii TaxID=2011161 RepID=A0A914W724_9BILA
MLHTTEMRMLRWTCGVTRLDKIPIIEKAQKHRLRWYDHIERRPDDHIGKILQRMKVEGKWPRGRPKCRWMDSIRNDMTACGLTEQDTADRDRWRSRIRKADPVI